MHVAITGASGFIGTALTQRLLDAGHSVTALRRDAYGDPQAFKGADAVVHLAGEPIAGRWSAEKKQAIRASRVDGTRAVVRALEALTQRPRVFVCASATGYYGNRADEPLVEGSPPGEDFLAGVCRDWEESARYADRLGIRTVQVRTGIVLGKGGALARMAPVFRWFAGGPFGSGDQFVPWIHIDDLIALYVFAIENDALVGPVNAVAPDYATSRRFAQALGAALHRPAILPAPGFALRAVLGEFAQSLLDGQLVLPVAARQAGFAWSHDLLERAIASALSVPDPWPAVSFFQTRQHVRAPLHEVFAFFKEPHNLEALTPPTLRLHIKKASPVVQTGATIEYALRVRLLQGTWKTLIAEWAPPNGFEDVQIRGPYTLWRHLHTFEAAADGGTIVSDRVLYSLPLYPLSAPLRSLIASEIANIFEFRRAKIDERFNYSQRAGIAAQDVGSAGTVY